jgi:hypothetical protein
MCNKLKIVVILILGILSGADAQTVTISTGIILPADTLVAQQLVNSLNGFLSQIDKPATQNDFVLKEQLLETSALLDEIRGMQQNAKLKDQHFYKCYLNNVVSINNTDYFIQISYIGIDGTTPILGAAFTLVATLHQNKFFFHSPLKLQTAAWKRKIINQTTYYFADKLNNNDIQAYQKAINHFNHKLNAPVTPTQFYYCADFTQVLKLLGVDYKMDYNGLNNNNLTATENKVNLVLNGTTSGNYKFDPHDLWHERLRTVLNANIINKPVDEGCAYLYGGSWGLTWPELLLAFKQYINTHPNANWESLYTNSVNYSDGSKPLKIAYMINALIVAKLEGGNNFTSVMQLLACGKRENGDANYFTALKKTTGIKRAEFNAYVWRLIKENHSLNTK